MRIKQSLTAIIADTDGIAGYPVGTDAAIVAIRRQDVLQVFVAIITVDIFIVVCNSDANLKAVEIKVVILNAPVTDLPAPQTRGHNTDVRGIDLDPFFNPALQQRVQIVERKILHPVFFPVQEQTLRCLLGGKQGDSDKQCEKKQTYVFHNQLEQQ